MKDDEKSREQLLAELKESQRRIAELKAAIAGKDQQNKDLALGDPAGHSLVATDPRQTEEALRESEERFRSVLENSLDAAYRRNLKTDDYDYMGPAVEQITGFSAEEMARMSIAEILERIHPEDRHKVSNEVTQSAEGRTATGVLEYRFRGKDGQYRWLADRFRTLPDANGHPLFCLGIVRDITEMKQAEKALRMAHDELEERVLERTAELARANEELMIFRRFAEASSQGFSMADLDGHITYVNPALCRILGEERPEEVIGKHLSTYFSEEDNHRGEQEIRPALNQQGAWQGELYMLSRHGKSIPTWHNTFMIRDDNGNFCCLAVVITDITERKKAEEALRQSHDELEAIYDGVRDGLVIFDIEAMRPVRVNPAFSQMFRYSREELLSLSPAQMHRAEDFPRIQRHFEAVVQGRASFFEGMPMLRKDGNLLYMDVASNRIVYNGRPCVISFLHDVTERRQAEEALKRERRTLEHLFRSSDHERQLIAYDIHDGLAQYLAGAIMQLDAFAHANGTRSLQAMKTFEAGMTMLRQGHCEARRLINGVRPPILDEAGIVAAVSHLIHELREPEGPKIDFHSEVGFGRLVPIQENAIYRIVQEGLTNACKYSKSEKVRVEIVQEGTGVRIVIQDWGIGFDPNKIGDNSFGLAGIRERTRLLGGRSTIEGGPGKGTRIVVELPLVMREDYA